MSYMLHGEKFNDSDKWGAYVADAALANRIGIVWGSSRNHVSTPSYRGQQCAGIVFVEGHTATADQYASGSKRVCIVVAGIMTYIAGDTHAIGTPLSLYNSSGHFGTALPGHHCVGTALRTVSSASNYGLMAFSCRTPAAMPGGVIIVPGGTFTADGSFTTGAPAGKYGYAFWIENTTANAVTGGLDIGTTSSGEELVSQQAIGASEEKYLGYDTATLYTALAAVDLTANDLIYISAHTAWNSASLNIWMRLELLPE